ncbi:hypothetical protein AVEN_247465-1 [Araneus ventricosus]|uniref:Uncharacterized protein n=1 Tax=Araneus ventricosus TaxID=182803 RepID=A0A4Y2J9Y2_ARAVE|nr:hypothetical protein AVEN_247465-1 [Araneus ventricosus]
MPRYPDASEIPVAANETPALWLMLEETVKSEIISTHMEETNCQPTLSPARLQLDCSENVDEEAVEQCILMFPSREHRSHEKESAVPFHIGGKQQDSCTWSSLTRRAKKKWLHTEGRHNAKESITVREHISGTLWCHP